MAKLDRKNFMFADKSDEVLIKKKGEINGLNFNIRRLNNCTVYILDHTNGMFIDECHNCKFVIAPINGSVMIRTSKNCTISVIAKQVRFRDCEDVNILAYIETEPVVESSLRINFGPFDKKFPNLRELFGIAFAPKLNKFNLVYDFTPQEKTHDYHFKIIEGNIVIGNVDLEGVEGEKEGIYDGYDEEVAFFNANLKLPYENKTESAENENIPITTNVKEVEKIVKEEIKETPKITENDNDVVYPENRIYDNLFDDAPENDNNNFPVAVQSNNREIFVDPFESNKPVEKVESKHTNDFQQTNDLFGDFNVNINTDKNQQNQDLFGNFQSENQYPQQNHDLFENFQNPIENTKEINQKPIEKPALENIQFSNQQNFQNFNNEDDIQIVSDNIQQPINYGIQSQAFPTYTQNFDYQMNNYDFEEGDPKEIEAAKRKRDFEEKRAQKIREKMHDEAKKKLELRSQAQEFLERFESQRNKAREMKNKNNLREETELLESRELAKKNNKNPWERVISMIDLKESDYKGTKNVTRMKECIINRRNDFKKI